MMVADTQRFDFENGRSVQPNNPCMLCGRISDTGLYSFCYRRIAANETFFMKIGLNSRSSYLLDLFCEKEKAQE